MRADRGLYLGFLASLLLALVLQLVPLPEWLAGARPLWVALILGYWALREPRISVLFSGFVAGLALDVLFGSALGQHALGLIIVVYLVERLRGIFVLFPLWQATFALIPVWIVYCFLMFWIDGATKHDSNVWLRWLPVISTTLFWPLVFSVMELLRQAPDDE
jgi:rod shape-determining protein MreD